MAGFVVKQDLQLDLQFRPSRKRKAWHIDVCVVKSNAKYMYVHRGVNNLFWCSTQEST